MNFRPNALLLAAGLAFAGAAAPTAAHAQIGVNIQLGHPNWGPAVAPGTQYYYVPEIDGYYDLQAQDYIVQRNGRWAHYRSLPGYDPRNFHPVALQDYRGRQPWDGYQNHHARYFRQGPPQGPGRSDYGHSQGRGKGQGRDNRGRDDHGRR